MAWLLTCNDDITHTDDHIHVRRSLSTRQGCIVEILAFALMWELAFCRSLNRCGFKKRLNCKQLWWQMEDQHFRGELSHAASQTQEKRESLHSSKGKAILTHIYHVRAMLLLNIDFWWTQTVGIRTSTLQCGSLVDSRNDITQHSLKRTFSFCSLNTSAV